MKAPHNESLTTFTFLATVLVVICHADVALPIRTELTTFFGCRFSNANVYNFFWLSGLFLGKHLGEARWWREALGKRLATIAVPYVLWNLVYFALRALTGKPAATGLAGFDALFGVTMGTTPACYPMWYLKTLYLFVVASPLFAWPLMACRTLGARVGLLAALVAAYVSARCAGLPDLPFWSWGHGGFDLFGFVLFCGGLWLAQARPDARVREWFARRPRGLVVAVALVAWTASAACAHVCPLLVVRELNIVVSSACLFAVACAIRRLPDVLTRNVFFVYALHTALLSVIGPRLPAAVAAHPLAAYALLVALVVALSVAAGEVTRRALPTLYAPLVGGRVKAPVPKVPKP